MNRLFRCPKCRSLYSTTVYKMYDGSEKHPRCTKCGAGLVEVS